jgi:hypothetical protein
LGPGDREPAALGGDADVDRGHRPPRLEQQRVPRAGEVDVGGAERRPRARMSRRERGRGGERVELAERALEQLDLGRRLADQARQLRADAPLGELLVLRGEQ